MGLFKSDERYVILTDSSARKTTWATLDFKVAGTRATHHACKWIIKITGITPQIMAEALERARKARFSILDIMIETKCRPQPEPETATLPASKPLRFLWTKIAAYYRTAGGKNIRALQEDTHTKIDIVDDGTVYIASTDGRGLWKRPRNASSAWWKCRKLVGFTPANACA
jgi:polyribonucleotide nucleotidyltransferase